ncbi:AzlD domain-containing protein [Pseudonocardia sp.]|jgi:branched-subunit amino acid transport protein|uniref:AzlD domain-containing protein n=1 Tax=Pseudonocardia sp. TaxID=60912 RepID=UPI003D13E98C
MGELLVLVAIGVGTYLMRAAFLATAGARPPAAVARLLQHVGPAVLAAIALPALVAPQGRIALDATVPALLAAVVAGVSWKFTRSLPLALFGGLVVAWAATWLLT